MHTTGPAATIPACDVIIAGGGLAGLVAAIVLAQQQKKVLLLEKKTYPYHKVCGEYVSNEVLGYLQRLGFDPFDHGASGIKNLRISTPSGKCIRTALDLGAFGLSRYTMDEQLAALAINKGAEVRTGTRVTGIRFADNRFTVTSHNGDTYTSKLVIGSWGKRELLDKKLERPFMDAHNRYMGVKYHIRTDYPADEIGLHNFNGGYCGISRIEDNKYNLCYLYRRPAGTAKSKSIREYEETALWKNPILKDIFTQSTFLYDAPVVINEICFAAKLQVEDHILMCGDSAGLITPLCGNGMSMAIAGAKLLTDLILQYKVLDQAEVSPESRLQLETSYQQLWNRQFRRRLFWGRTIQGLFGAPILTEISVRAVHSIPALEKKLIGLTHGKPL